MRYNTIRFLAAIVAGIGVFGRFVQCVYVDEVMPHRLKGCDDVK